MLSKPHRERDKKYLEFIRECPCIACLVTTEFNIIECDPHHVNEKGKGGIGTKCSDYRAIPLCHAHHVEVHQVGRDSFADEYGLDYETVISRLNKIWEESNESK